VNRAQRRALAHPDGGCVFPGCDRPASWTDAHHVEHWQHGGPTDLANLASLCRYHHGVVHRHGWTMHVTDDQWFWWTTPTGDTFWSQRQGRQRAGPTPAHSPPLRT
jgi:HNH endonuclease